VCAGGTIVIVDHVADEDGESRAWSEEIERLRDPAHWACLSGTRMRMLGAETGLELTAERLVPFTIDFDEWLTRGTSDRNALRLVETALNDRTQQAECFVVHERADARELTLQVWMGAYTVPHSSWTSAPTGSNGARSTAAQPSVSTIRRSITAPVCSA
jgi:hypothetical protein